MPSLRCNYNRKIVIAFDESLKTRSPMGNAYVKYDRSEILTAMLRNYPAGGRRGGGGGAVVRPRDNFT